MDPNETLRRMRVLASDLDDNPTLDTVESVAYGLAECVTALDDWLSRGGFLPEAWESRPYRPE